MCQHVFHPVSIRSQEQIDNLDENQQNKSNYPNVNINNGNRSNPKSVTEVIAVQNTINQYLNNKLIQKQLK